MRPRLVSRVLMSLAGVAAIAAPAWAATAPSPAVKTGLGASRGLPANYLGVNFDYGGVAHDPSAVSPDQRLVTLRPGTLRWPGGTGANYFQWRRGYPVNAPSVNPGACPAPAMSNRFRFTLADLLSAYRATHAPPIFDLNVMTSTLQDQLAMLTEAKRLGLPIDYVELGNEFYLCNNDYVHYFPTAASYGLTVASYVTAVHRQFPGAVVAAVGALRTDSPREQSWNQDMLVAAKQAGGRPDAITLHEYPQYTQALMPDGLRTLFAEPYAGEQDIKSVISKLPVAEPAWIDEYNLKLKYPAGGQNPAQRTYAQGLFVAEMELLTSRVGDSRLLDFWSAFGGQSDYAYFGTTLTPSGLALEWINGAAHCATRSAELTFKGGPTEGSSEAALIGQAFSSRTTQREVIVNLGASSVLLRGAAAIPSGAAYRQVTGDPARQTDAASQLTTSAGRVGNTISIPKYSITVIGPKAQLRCTTRG